MSKRILVASAVAFGASQLVSITMLAVTGHSVAEACRWDCNWYRSIVEHGYDIEPTVGPRGDFSNWSFWPALPMLARLVVSVSGLPASTSLILVGKASYAVALYWFARLCSIYRPGIDPSLAVSVAALQPYAIYGNVGYTEPLFFALTCAALVFAREGRVLMAGVVGAMATTVRLPALFLAPAFAVRLWVPPVLKLRLPGAPAVFAVVLTPLGLATFSLYEYVKVGDGLAFVNNQRAWHPTLTNSFRAISDALSNMLGALLLLPGALNGEISWESVRALGLHNSYYALTSLFALASLWAFSARKEFDLLAFSLLATLVPLAVSLGSMPRYIWWQPPVLLLVAAAAARRWFAYAYFVVSAVVTPVTYLGWFSDFAFVT